jgi:hypothetical protein
VALLPGWLVVRGIGVTLGDRKIERERRDNELADKDQK